MRQIKFAAGTGVLALVCLAPAVHAGDITFTLADQFSPNIIATLVFDAPSGSDNGTLTDLVSASFSNGFTTLAFSPISVSGNATWDSHGISSLSLNGLFSSPGPNYDVTAGTQFFQFHRDPHGVTSGASNPSGWSPVSVPDAAGTAGLFALGLLGLGAVQRLLRRQAGA